MATGLEPVAFSAVRLLFCVTFCHAFVVVIWRAAGYNNRNIGRTAPIARRGREIEMKHAGLFLAALCLVLLAGCSPQTDTAPTAPAATPPPTPAGTATPTPTAAPTPAPVPTPEATHAPVQPQPTAGATAAPSVPTPAASPEPTPEEEPEGPGEEEVLEAYDRAEELYSWFHGALPPVDWEDLREVNDSYYYRVAAPGPVSLADLRGQLRGLFSDEIVDELLPVDGKRFLELDGALYVLAGEGREGGVRGAVSRQVLRESSTRFLVRVTADDAVPHEFPYEKVGERWIFTSFYQIV